MNEVYAFILLLCRVLRRLLDKFDSVVTVDLNCRSLDNTRRYWSKDQSHRLEFRSLVVFVPYQLRLVCRIAFSFSAACLHS